MILLAFWERVVSRLAMCSRAYRSRPAGSVELDIKQKLMQAKEQAAKIIADAEYRSAVFETERLAPIEEREEKLTAKEEHIALARRIS